MDANSGSVLIGEVQCEFKLWSTPYIAAELRAFWRGVPDNKSAFSVALLNGPSSGSIASW
jgi:hypothetical protein